MSTINRVSFCKDSLGDVNHDSLLDLQIKLFRDIIFSGSSTLNNSKISSYFRDHFPVKDPKGNFEVHFVDYSIGYPRKDSMECIRCGVTYSVTLKVKFKLIKKILLDSTNKESFEETEEEIFLGEIPYMTNNGSFIINGIERVVVSLIHKSVGVFFSHVAIPGSTDRFIYSAKLIPMSGPWIDFSVSANGVIYAYIDRKRKLCFTTLLRALGYDSDDDILVAFNVALKIKNTKEDLNKYIGCKLMGRIIKKWTCDIVNETTGEIKKKERAEVLVDRGIIISEKIIPTILSSGAESIVISRDESDTLGNNLIYNTLEKDNTNSTIEAAYKVYKKLKGIDGGDDISVVESVQNIFFDPAKYSLGEIGRYKINKKLKLDISLENLALTTIDIISIIKYLIFLVNTRGKSDDIDHLSNRRIKTVSEHFNLQFGLGVFRLSKIILDRIANRESDDIKIIDLVNTKIFSNLISSIFYANNSLSQFMDQVNPLSEITHKRRLSAIGPGGLPKDTRVGFEVRDSHYTHEGNICPIETPEGDKIGLITHLSTCAKVNEKGFLESPYKKVENGIVDISGNYHYLAVEDKDLCNIAQSTVKIDKDGKILGTKVRVLHKGDIVEVSVDQVDYVQFSSVQMVSVSTSLIPFLEHNDPSRALMGANMQRQAIPLLKAQSPIVGTGMEKYIAKNFGGLLYAENDGKVLYVDSKKIKIEYKNTEEEKLLSFDDSIKTYDLVKLYGTNQKTFIDYKPIVSKGDFVKKGDCLTEGYATDKGELALGTNLKVAFLSKRGYTFEDAIVVSDRLVKEDILTSIYVEEFSLETKDTKLGQEEFTSEIPGIGDEAIKNLDKNGIVKVGTVVNGGDILIGKLIPRNDGDPTPEEKLLRAIFGNKAGEVKDVSLRLPQSMNGIVIDVKLLEKKSYPINDEDRARKLAEIKKQKVILKDQYLWNFITLKKKLGEKLSKTISNKNLTDIEAEIISKLFPGGMLFDECHFSEKIIDKSKDLELICRSDVEFVEYFISEKLINRDKKSDLLNKILYNYLEKIEKNISFYKTEIYKLEVGDELPIGILKRAKVVIAQLRKIKEGDKMSGRHGNKGVISKIIREEDMPFMENGEKVDIVLNPLGISSRMNLGQVFELFLGLAGSKLKKKYASPVFSGATEDEIKKEMIEAGLEPMGKMDLYDGLTGEKFAQKVAVGIMYMIKLNHMAEDKIHAISTENYSLVTNQPLKGRAQLGGQRFGEMEVWASNAYGAAHSTRDMLTIKSDDVIGREKAYEALVKGENIEWYTTPEAFNVLIHNLRGLGLEVETF